MINCTRPTIKVIYRYYVSVFFVLQVFYSFSQVLYEVPPNPFPVSYSPDNIQNTNITGEGNKQALTPISAVSTFSASCTEMGFESGDFTGWSGACGLSSTCCQQPGFNVIEPDQQLIKPSSGTDICSGLPLNSPGGGNFVALLGNTAVGEKAQTISKTWQVQPEDSIFIYWYMVVLQNPQNHTTKEQPFFEIIMFDQNGDTIPCSYYYVAAGTEPQNFLPSSTCFPGKNTQYKPWTPAFINLKPYTGQNVTIRFKSADCLLGDHFSYAYIDITCKKPEAIPNDTICEGASTTFTAPSGNGATYLWNTGATTQTITATTAGDYEVTVTYKGGCSTKFTTKLSVIPKPDAVFTTGVQTCNPNVTFNANGSSAPAPSTITGYSWSFGDGASSTSVNPNHTYTGNGTYNVSLVVTSSVGCRDTLIQPVIIAGSAVDFTASPVCQNNPTLFNDTLVGGVTNSWQWNFGDGGTSISQNPSHTYANAGTYTVTLISTDTSGCKDTAQKAITIYTLPNADFSSVVPTCSPTAAFTNSSSGNGNTYAWSFGNGQTSSQVNPSNTYTTIGTYTVTLITTTINGCVDSVSKTVDINSDVIAKFFADTVCLGSATTFTDQSSVSLPGNSINSWSWNFGDGQLSNTQSPTHTFATPGSYNVSLTVTSSGGCAATIANTIQVADFPVANFSDTVPPCSSTATFTNLSTGGPFSLYQWNLGNGSTSTLQNPVGNYTAVGTYSVTLVVSNLAGCSDTLQKTINISAPAIANFSAAPVCLGEQTSFSNLSTASTGVTITGYAWNFGVANSSSDTSSQSSPSFSYNSSGTYTVSLSVFTNSCTNTFSQSVVVNPLPQASFTSGDVCSNQQSGFSSTSSIGNGSISYLHWDFGDTPANDTSNLSDPKWIYASPGTYTVSLIAVSTYGCSDTTVGTVTVNPKPVADFGPGDKGCAPVCVNISDLSSTSSGSVINWFWTFGDGSSSDSPTPNYCYKTPGVYDVSLIVTTDKNCSDTIVRDSVVEVYPFPTADFSISPEEASYFDPSFFFSDLSSGAVTWQWNFGDSATWHTANGSTEYTYSSIDNEAYSFTVSLAVINEFGCPDTIEKPVKINPEWAIYVPNTFTPTGDSQNEGFIAKGFGIKEFEMYIYDRWGNQIYHCNDINEPWNGRVQNKSTNEIAQIDTYVWLIQIRDVFEKTHNYNGHVNLIK